MAMLEVNKKVNYVGVWLEDVFADQLIHNVAGYAKAEKGKKVKLTLNSVGLFLKRTKWFSGNKTEFYPILSVRAVMRNPRLASCVMFVLADPVKKYKIIALRCASEADAIHLNNMFSQIQRDMKTADVEMRKRDNGNWTLRERSAHNANRHLAEIFKERTNEPDPYKHQVNGDVVPRNGSSTYVPILDKSKVITTDSNVAVHTSYVKRNGNPVPAGTVIATNTIMNNNNDVKKIDAYTVNDDYVIETEVEPYPYTSRSSNGVRHYSSSTTDLIKPATEAEVAAFKGDLNSLTEEVKGLKTILQTMATGDSVDGSRAGSYGKTSARHYYTRTALPSRPRIYTTSSHGHMNRSADLQPTVMRAPPKTYEAKIMSVRSYPNDIWSSHRRVSGSFILPPKVDYRIRHGADSERSSGRVKFDSESIRSGTSSKRSKSLSLRPSDYSMMTTIEKPIEETYARPVVLQRYSSSQQVLGMRPRPHSYHHVAGGNELKVYHPKDYRYMDVAL